MFFTDQLSTESGGRRSQGIHRREDTQLGNGALQNHGSVQVSKSGCGCRIRQIICRNINCLERSDGPFLGGSNTFLKVPHLGCQGWLISHGTWSAPQQSGYFGTCLRESEDIVDKQQHVLILFITEILRDGQTRECHAQTGPGGFIHLAVNKGNLGVFQLVLFDDASIGHFSVEIVTFAGSFAHSSKH